MAKATASDFTTDSFKFGDFTKTYADFNKFAADYSKMFANGKAPILRFRGCLCFAAQKRRGPDRRQPTRLPGRPGGVPPAG